VHRHSRDTCSATAGGLDQLDEAIRWLRLTVEVLCRPGHSMGKLGGSLLPAPLNSEQHQTYGASGNDQDHKHGDDDGSHDFPFRQSTVWRTGKELSYKGD
jgi:hypothetical protein